MQARTTSPHVTSIATWALAILGLALLVVLFLSFALEKRTQVAVLPAGLTSSRIAYLEFGTGADTLYAVAPAEASARTQILSIPHAPEFGLVPSMAPDGKRFVYTALPPQTPAPSHDSPAGLWLVSLTDGSEPRLLAQAVDLLVRPMWAPDGSAVVYRRSDVDGHTIAMHRLAGGDEHVLIATSDAALFPAGFSPAGDLFYYVALNDHGSQLYANEFATGSDRKVGVLSAGMTRDWALAPDGSRLAYLEVGFSRDAVSSRALVFDLTTGNSVAVTSPEASAFGPIWGPTGAFVVGAIDETTGQADLIGMEGGAASVLAIEQGFDVPLSFYPNGPGFLVRSFEGDSALKPGRSTLTLVTDGVRQTIATGEVTFVGWINP
jgi:Tol biopolymer transport system component